MNKITLETSFPLAVNSPDHLVPWGTKNDNSTNKGFIDEVINYAKNEYALDKINFMDLGCSGGQLAVDFNDLGHFSIGLEGSDYSIIHGRANWPTYHNTVLFTYDITKPYAIMNDGEKVLFDVITAWEVVEHIHPNDLDMYFLNINNSLKVGGIFLASISVNSDVINGVELHQSRFSEEVWMGKLQEIAIKNNMTLSNYPFNNKVRDCEGSFFIQLKKNK